MKGRKPAKGREPSAGSPRRAKAREPAKTRSQRRAGRRKAVQEAREGPGARQWRNLLPQGRACFQTSRWQGVHEAIFKTRRWVGRAFISTSRARGISIRAAEGPLKPLSTEWIRGEVEKPVRREGFLLDLVRVGRDTSKTLDVGLLRSLVHACLRSC